MCIVNNGSNLKPRHKYGMSEMTKICRKQTKQIEVGNKFYVRKYILLAKNKLIIS